MSDSGDTSSTQNGSDPMQRLASMKAPRDLSLGVPKPNKKVFVPNLKVTRNKNKGLEDHSGNDGKKDRKNRHDHKNNKNNFKSQVIKSSGVFSEGLGATERRTTSRISYGQGSEAPVTLERPVIRVKQAWKIDKELEEQKIKNLMGEENLSEDEEPEPLTSDMPVRLPLVDAGSLLNKKKPKQEVLVKQEPADVDPAAIPLVNDVDKKPAVDVKKGVYDDTDLLTMLRGDQSTLMLLQLPDSLPGRGGKSKQPPQKPSKSDEKETNETESKPEDERCRLTDLEEGRIGRLLIHQSGRIRLALGDTTFDVHPGTRTSFRQEAVSVAYDDPTKSANITALGQLNHKLILVPDWEALLKDV